MAKELTKELLSSLRERYDADPRARAVRRALTKTDIFDIAKIQENGPIIPQSIQASLSMFGKSHPVSANGAAVRNIALPTCARRVRSGARFASPSTAVWIG